MVDPSMDVLDWFRKTVSEAEPDLLKELMQAMLERLMGAEADVLCGAGYRERSDARVNRRNGHRVRDFDTRVGTLALAIPKLRQGSYFPDWLLEHRRRAERAVIAAVAEAYVLGVSTRKMEKLVQTLGIASLSKSQVSEMAKELDEMVVSFRNRPLDAGPYVYVSVDAMVVKCREGGRIVNVAVVVATGVNADGHREVLGMDVFTSEDGAAWMAFLRSLVARGLSGVQMVISDAHEGLKAAIAAVLPGASWQRCRTHFMRNLLTRVAKSTQDFVAAAVRSIFAQPSPEEVHAQHRRVVAQLEKGFPQASALLEEAGPDVLAFAAFPKEHWRQIWSNNPQERLNKELRRRTDVVGIFPNRAAVIRLVGAVLCEQNDEWIDTRRYMSQDSLQRAIRPQERQQLEEAANKQIPVAA
jgi:transposase-like protein